MTFQAVKCDECGHIQGESNHWTRMTIWLDRDAPDRCLGVAVGPVSEDAMATGEYTMAKKEIHDLCGQGCAVKHLAKLLKWNVAEV